MISSHDFTRTRRPDGLNQTAQRIAAFEPEFVKVVSTARSLADNLSVLHMVQDQSSTPTWWASPWARRA